jgi:hypothetical protein
MRWRLQVEFILQLAFTGLSLCLLFDAEDKEPQGG